MMLRFGAFVCPRAEVFGESILALSFVEIAFGLFCCLDPLMFCVV